MNIQKDMFEVRRLKELPSRRRGELMLALEGLMAVDVHMRVDSFSRIMEMDAHRRSPLASGLLALRVKEPDLHLRARIVECLADCLGASREDVRPPESVQIIVRSVLSEMGEGEVRSLLRLIIRSDLLKEPVCIILDQCSLSGDILLEILANHNNDIPLRVAAAEMIGMIGYIEAMSTVDSIEKRLMDRSDDQLSMAFAPRFSEEISILLPVLKRTLEELEEASV
ncbi:MAG: hypothetical protein GTO18_09675 [Anaerolineales bacterium]|nr:hypothetical protein [Anaerolineales bacterium]